MNILVLYNSTQTFTNTVFEHLNSFKNHSANVFYFLHKDQWNSIDCRLDLFDAVIVHYTIRLPFNQILPRDAEQLAAFGGLKALFIQDEYDHTWRTWDWIEQCRFDVVFTVVPEQNVDAVYPPERFPGVTFVSNLTGYVPETLPRKYGMAPPSRRSLVVGYRGRALPVRYGELGFDKISIGQLVKPYCEKRKIAHDIGWTEQDRIYGPAWYEFMARCRGMLGTESGSNVFDWNGDLDQRILKFRKDHPGVGEEEIYNSVVAEGERPGLMNQLSPRIFESIALHTVAVLFKGEYSGVIKPDVHYISLEKDLSNIDDVFEKLSDGAYVDNMARRAYDDIIGSGAYSYATFVGMVDSTLATAAKSKGLTPRGVTALKKASPAITRSPIRSLPVTSILTAIRGAHSFRDLTIRLRDHIWSRCPESVRAIIRPVLRRARGIG